MHTVSSHDSGTVLLLMFTYILLLLISLLIEDCMNFSCNLLWHAIYITNIVDNVAQSTGTLLKYKYQRRINHI